MLESNDDTERIVIMKHDKKLAPDMDLNDYFESGEFALLSLGSVCVTSGKIIAADPLFSLPYGGTAPFLTTVPKGSYPVTIAVGNHPSCGDRYLAAKLTFSKNHAEYFQLALKPGESASELQKDEIFGFPVETGLGSFCDEATQKAFSHFCSQWHKQHPDQNIYDDYFADFFAKSYEDRPEFQRPGGDWINWNIPDTNHNIIMFNSGFGDGVYPCYWGYDSKGDICCLIIQFISPIEME